MVDEDNRNEITIYRHRTGMYDKEESKITLKSKDESIDMLLDKAKEFTRDKGVSLDI
jgi:hypothetical protein